IKDKRWQVARNYQVFRYQLGCNAFGSFPTKFNGGLFTTDPEYVAAKSGGIAWAVASSIGPLGDRLLRKPQWPATGHRIADDPRKNNADRVF
ncbi:MAG: hypothetical protein ACF8TS_07270, partial [Maioricimonas sp. JB049]